jgi:hypothetical protein
LEGANYRYTASTLAGTDRLDKELMIGQMQGKFQMVVLPASGHCVGLGV